MVVKADVVNLVGGGVVDEASLDQTNKFVLIFSLN